MLTTKRGNIGCSVNDMFNLDGYAEKPEQALKDFAQQYYFAGGTKGQFVTFSHRATNPSAEAIERYILEQKLGDVWRSPAVPNPNYSNDITHTNCIWVWTIDQVALKAWADKMEVKKVEPPKPAAVVRW